MGLFDVLKQTIKVGLDVITLPVDIIKDTVTMGGALTDEEPATLKKLKKFADDVNEIPDKVNE